MYFGKANNVEKRTVAGNAESAITLNSSSSTNMREETEFSISNFDSKSHVGTDLTTVSGEPDEFRTPSFADISTVSQQVATTTHQQQAIAISLSASFHSVLNHSSASASSTAPNSHQVATPTPPAIKLLASIANPHHNLTKRRQLLEARRERKAAQTLAIITGAFVVCWLPFFVMALLLSLCKACHIHATIASIFLWLGYFNSTLNPIIYTIFNPEFRRAFRRILLGRKHYTHCRNGNI